MSYFLVLRGVIEGVLSEVKVSWGTKLPQNNGLGLENISKYK